MIILTQAFCSQATSYCILHCGLTGQIPVASCLLVALPVATAEPSIFLPFFEMQLIDKHAPSVGYFQKHQVVKGPPLPIRERMAVCPTVKAWHPVSYRPPSRLLAVVKLFPSSFPPLPGTSSCNTCSKQRAPRRCTCCRHLASLVLHLP
jgi:hypothetical protein